VTASKNWTLNATAAARKKFDGGLTGQSTTSTPWKFDLSRRNSTAPGSRVDKTGIMPIVFSYLTRLRLMILLLFCTRVHHCIWARLNLTSWSVTHGSLIVAWRHSSTMSFIGWMCQRVYLQDGCHDVPLSSWSDTLPTISPRPPTSLLGFVCVLQTVTISLYLAVVSTHMAVAVWSPVRRSETHCLTSSEIRRAVLTILSSFLRQSCSVFTDVTSALEVFKNVMRYINPRFTYLLTYFGKILLSDTCWHIIGYMQAALTTLQTAV